MKLLTFLRELFTTTNDYFERENMVLHGKEYLESLLLIWEYEIQEREIYKQVFDHFVKNPQQFNGASYTEELCDIPGLDLDAMLHDYLYVVLNASVSFKYTWKADKLLRNESRRRGKSTWNTGYRFIMLVLKTPFFIPWCYLIKGRRITSQQETTLDKIFHFLEKPEDKPWYQEYAGEITWFIIFVGLGLGYIYRTDFLKYLLPF